MDKNKKLKSLINSICYYNKHQNILKPLSINGTSTQCKIWLCNLKDIMNQIYLYIEHHHNNVNLMIIIIFINMI